MHFWFELLYVQFQFESLIVQAVHNCRFKQSLLQTEFSPWQLKLEQLININMTNR